MCSYRKVLEVAISSAQMIDIDIAIPGTVMTDFEMSIILAVNEVVGHDKVRACFFHLCQNVHKRVVSEGLKAAYEDAHDETIRKHVHMLCALAFVPAARVARHYDELKEELPQAIHPIADYFEHTYIRVRRIMRGRGNLRLRIITAPPRYPTAIWNQYEAVLNNFARTNNMSEGWHNKFQMVVGKHHPSMYAFLRELQKEQQDAEITLRQLQIGQKVRKGQSRQRKKYEEQIFNIVAMYEDYYENNDILTYLENIGHNIKL